MFKVKIVHNGCSEILDAGSKECGNPLFKVNIDNWEISSCMEELDMLSNEWYRLPNNLKTVVFKPEHGYTHGRNYFLNDEGMIVNSHSGLKIDFFIKPVDVVANGRESVFELLTLMNGFIENWYQVNNQVDETLILALDQLFFRNGYYGKVLSESPIIEYASALIVNHPHYGLIQIP